MIINMRTTLILQDDVVREVKKKAAERNLTLSEFVNDALRATLAQTPGPAQPFTPITFGKPGRRVHHEPADFQAALDAEDRDRLR